MSGSEAETIWMSRIAMNMPITITMKAVIRRRVSTGALASAAAARPAGRDRALT